VTRKYRLIIIEERGVRGESQKSGPEIRVSINI
jgi:hypothetical protein